MAAPAKSAGTKSATCSSDATSGSNTKRLIRSSDLLHGKREVLIEHAGELYSLRHTSKGKLILTK